MKTRIRFDSRDSLPVLARVFLARVFVALSLFSTTLLSTTLLSTTLLSACNGAGANHPRSHGAAFEIQEIQLVEPEHVHALNTPRTAYMKWLKGLGAHLQKSLASSSGLRQVTLVLTLTPQGPLRVQLAANPPLSPKKRVALETRIAATQAPNTRFICQSLKITIRLNGGAKAPPGKTKGPRRLQPCEVAFQKEFETAGTTRRLSLLRRWAKKGALPLLAEALAQRDPSPKWNPWHRSISDGSGARRPGAGPSKRGEKEKESSWRQGSKEPPWRWPAYWSTLMRSPADDLVVPTSVVFHFVAKGELDRARNVFRFVYPFTRKESLEELLLGRLRRLLETFYSDVDSAVDLALDLRRRGDARSAQEALTKLLQRYPHSARGRFELMKTRAQQGQGPDAPGKKRQMESRVLSSDPLFPYPPVAAESKAQAWRHHRRASLARLFAQPKRVLHDLVHAAMVALDLKVYGEASLLFFLLARSTPRATLKEMGMPRHPVSYLVLCLEMMGLSEVKDLFKKDYVKASKAIERGRQEAMEQSEIYQSFTPRSKSPP